MDSFFGQSWDPAELSKLAEKKIFFGHHSVGQSVMASVETIVRKSDNAGPQILESSDPSSYEGPLFGHSRIGYNGDPVSKNIAFKNFLDNLRFWKPDIALFKYCYVDIKADSDVDALCDRYWQTNCELSGRYPDTIVVPVTIPLKTMVKGMGAAVQQILGRGKGSLVANIKRNAFNERLRNLADGKAPIFDLAAAESQSSSQQPESFSVNGRRYDALYEKYASDGGHLNEIGAHQVAINLLRLLMRVAC